MKFSIKLLTFLIFVSISPLGHGLTVKHVQLFDSERNRSVPIVFYHGDRKSKLPAIVINHGYGAKNTEYTCIANALAERGYFVVSIQHDLETDKILPRIGNLFEKRKSFWERGVKNILFVIEELKKTEDNIDLKKIILIGHSNGGDISMMFADLHPEMVSKIISLDSLRHPFPINEEIPILRFGAVDTRPDEGVVPINGVDVIFIKDAKHIDLCDRGSEFIKDAMRKSIAQFLR